MNQAINYSAIRDALATMPSDHDASGEYRPTAAEVFTPEQHANALDPNTPIVVGARGTGKSFWAGVLEQEDTRAVAAAAYPNLGLDRLIVRAAYTGFSGDNLVTPKTIVARVPLGEEHDHGFDFWQAVVLRAALSAVFPNRDALSIRELITKYSDPEDAADEFSMLDKQLTAKGKMLLITFDALDTMSSDWKRSSMLLDALFEVVWSLRARRSIRAKVFIRPEQLNDESLRFVELPKLRSGRVELEWRQAELYGLLYSRLALTTNTNAHKAFREIAIEVGAPVPSDIFADGQDWLLKSDKRLQQRAMEFLAGPYMGRGHKKGGTYDWPYKHLSDAKGKVTPRSFLKLFVEAAKFGQPDHHRALSPEGIRHGLREASRVRVDQLVVEYKWVKRALAPLAGLIVPCELDEIYSRWADSDTVNVILKSATDKTTGFLPPFPPRAKGDKMELLAVAMERLGLFAHRQDGRIDIPDLFRVAAAMLKKGGTTPLRNR